MIIISQISFRDLEMINFDLSLIIFYIIFMITQELDDGVHSRTTTLVKNISLSNGQCKHTNTVHVIRIDNQEDQVEPKIISSVAEQQDNVLKRLTEIHYKKIKYIVEDQYQFSNLQSHIGSQRRSERSFISSSQECQNSNQSNLRNPSKIKRNKYKKYCIFQRLHRNGRKFIKRNTKNIPKNFCKAFLNHMQSLPKKQQEWSLAINDFKKIESKSKNKYNNILMHRLLSNPRICSYFKQFLSEHAKQWITNSKITDKQIHLEAIQIYFKLLNNLAYAEVDPSQSDQ